MFKLLSSEDISIKQTNKHNKQHNHKNQIDFLNTTVSYHHQSVIKINKNFLTKITIDNNKPVTISFDGEAMIGTLETNCDTTLICNRHIDFYSVSIGDHLLKIYQKETGNFNCYDLQCKKIINVKRLSKLDSV